LYGLNEFMTHFHTEPGSAPISYPMSCDPKKPKLLSPDVNPHLVISLNLEPSTIISASYAKLLTLEIFLHTKEPLSSAQFSKEAHRENTLHR
jgi:hypothetical protein